MKNVTKRTYASKPPEKRIKRETPLTKLIRKRMEEIDMNQCDLAGRLDVGQGLISNVLSGTRVVPKDRLWDWARALKLEVGSAEYLAFEKAVNSGQAHALTRAHAYVAEIEAEVGRLKRDNLRLKGELTEATTRITELRNQLLRKD